MSRATENLEKLTEDLLEDDFVNIFLIPHLILSALGFQRVKIKLKFPSTPSKLCLAYSCVFWLTNVLAVIDYLIFNWTIFESMDHFIKAGLVVDTLINAEISRQNMFRHGDLNSQLYVKMQRIDRILNFKKARSVNAYILKRGAIGIFLCCASWFLYMFIFNTKISSSFRLSGCLAACSKMPLNIEVCLCCIILNCVKKRVEYINELLRRDSNKTNKLKSNDRSENQAIWMTIYNISPTKQLADNAVHGIRSVLETLADFVKLFQYSVLSFTSQLLLWVMIFVQSVITAIKEQMMDNSSTHLSVALTSCLSILTMTTSLLALCFLSQSLLNKLGETRSLCYDIMTSLEFNDESRKNAKNGLMLLDTMKYNFSIYDIYTIDANLPLSLLEITTTYVVVLLQFAFLD